MSASTADARLAAPAPAAGAPVRRCGSNSSSKVKSLMCGGVAGCVAKTATAAVVQVHGVSADVHALRGLPGGVRAWAIDEQTELQEWQVRPWLDEPRSPRRGPGAVEGQPLDVLAPVPFHGDQLRSRRVLLVVVAGQIAQVIRPRASAWRTRRVLRHRGMLPVRGLADARHDATGTSGEVDGQLELVVAAGGRAWLVPRHRYGTCCHRALRCHLLLGVQATGGPPVLDVAVLRVLRGWRRLRGGGLFHHVPAGPAPETIAGHEHGPEVAQALLDCRGERHLETGRSPRLLSRLHVGGHQGLPVCGDHVLRLRIAGAVALTPRCRGSTPCGRRLCRGAQLTEEE
eukprot:CAMPEP_0198497114 /NCGR_PEP_ID=MMETSP1462-20131121/6216_1 /TAXON_ID=1333877 /ORGANISM="Brandtodinium nutriculum, Strain RCC3387" /LENGTH=342 /DNA_ID=CAMNT_0044225967 /DNA_START=87 /DNA_END=1111 /DNA_ORIENTATION=+